MAAERQAGAGTEENKENERPPAAAGKAGRLGDTLGLESILTPGGRRGPAEETHTVQPARELTCQSGWGARGPGGYPALC